MDVDVDAYVCVSVSVGSQCVTELGKVRETRLCHFICIFVCEELRETEMERGNLCLLWFYGHKILI